MAISARYLNGLIATDAWWLYYLMAISTRHPHGLMAMYAQHLNGLMAINAWQLNSLMAMGAWALNGQAAIGAHRLYGQRHSSSYGPVHLGTLYTLFCCGPRSPIGTWWPGALYCYSCQGHCATVWLGRLGALDHCWARRAWGAICLLG